MPPGIGYRGRGKRRGSVKPKKGVNPGVRGTATPNARAVARANPNASFKRSPTGFDLSRFLGQVGNNVRGATGKLFPAGQGSAIPRAMKTGQDENNPLKRILRGG